MDSGATTLSLVVDKTGQDNDDLPSGIYRVYIGNTAYDLTPVTPSGNWNYNSQHNNGAPVMTSGQTYAVRLVRVATLPDNAEIWSASLYAGQSGESNGSPTTGSPLAAWTRHPSI